ncbi:SLAC1 anion channel family protein [Orrella daihaiensis]|uniref:SLAC1 anion channel family protein n=1 Tax=Orrella daihaiensis TaxID=2782176 RepID=A0ABY4ANU3_9BURK|nr:SLAC1 anion channel family protein [Orrella daihaiensis]UOD51065.1 SLAC1 anion channel family protein [Orrella daihaiensis]
MNKLAHMPIAIFASVMGMSGLTLGWLKAGSMGWPLANSIGLAAAVVTTVLLAFLLLMYGVKASKYWSAVCEEARHPVKLNFFAAIPIGFILVSTLWSGINSAIAAPIWWVGVCAMLVATLLTMNSWIHHSHYQVGHLNPAWFIPVVGNILVPIAGMRLGQSEISWFFFSIGVVFWIVLTTLVMNRLIFHDALIDRMRPTLFILLAPPAVGFVSYLSLNGMTLDAFARILYFTALFLAMLLGINAVRFLKLPFFISGWAYSFPIAAMTVASFQMGQLTNLFGYMALAWALLALLTVVVLYLAYKTLVTLFAGKLLAPEPAH